MRVKKVYMGVMVMMVPVSPTMSPAVVHAAAVRKGKLWRQNTV